MGAVRPPTSWWMLSMARLYLSHSLCMLSKLEQARERCCPRAMLLPLAGPATSGKSGQDLLRPTSSTRNYTGAPSQGQGHSQALHRGRATRSDPREELQAKVSTQVARPDQESWPGD